MAKTTFATILAAGFVHIGVHATHYLHFMRVFAVFLASMYYVARASVLTMGRWNRDKLAQHYQAAVKPADALVGAAGFPAGSPALIAAYRTPRADVQPPPELLLLVWPWAAEALVEVRARNAALSGSAAVRKAAAATTDIAAEHFLSVVLPWLAVVLLQDCAVIQAQVLALYSARSCPLLLSHCLRRYFCRRPRALSSSMPSLSTRHGSRFRSKCSNILRRRWCPQATWP